MKNHLQKSVNFIFILNSPSWPYAFFPGHFCVQKWSHLGEEQVRHDHLEAFLTFCMDNYKYENDRTAHESN